MTARSILVTLAAVAALGVALGPEPARGDFCDTRGRRCSTPPGSPGKAARVRALAAARLAPGERIVVPVAYHFVYGSYRAAVGEPEDDLVHAPPLALAQRQTRALQRAFRGTGISFVTAEASFQDFSPWRDHAHGPGSRALDSEIATMVQDLTANRDELLHVFLLREAANRAAAPDTRTMFETIRATDGIVMNWDYLPYVPALREVQNPIVRRYYYEGELLVHLVGHYLGLVHTFEAWDGEQDDEASGSGGSKAALECGTPCSQTSDGVRDTPPHRWIWGNLGRCRPLDTCKDAPGMDPMTNYMNLEPDLCASEFTPGQVGRIERMVRFFRPYLVAPAADAR